MDHLTINIAYIADNHHLISKMVSDLKNTEVSFNLIDGNSFVDGESFYARLIGENRFCLLMISDNFLKSQSCLNKGLAYLQTLIKNDQVVPIIIDGTEIDEAGNRQLIPTEFEKVSNVIKYMNFWQEKYLDLRKLKRGISAAEEEEFSKNLKVVRGISSEVGEYLRNLRDANYFPFSEFSANDYEVFFRILGNEEDYTKFIATQSQEVHVMPSESAAPVTQQSIQQESIIEDSKTIAEPTPEVTNNFLPFDDLVVEKEKIDTLSEEELTEMPDNINIETNEVSNLKEVSAPEENPLNIIEKITDAQKEEIIAMDPEWDLAETEEDEEEEEATEEEISLDEIAISEERPLTETELLALELAQKLPLTENETQVHSELNVIEDSTESEEEEEEMISLKDLMGEDFLEVEISDIAAAATITTMSTAAVNGSKKYAANQELFEESNVPEKGFINIEMEEDYEEELEGYVMDEGEETEDYEEELSELDVLQSANILVQSGKVEEGISLLKETLEEVPDFVSVRYQYAAFLAKFQNDFKESANQLAILLDQEPNNISAKFFLGELAEAERDYLTAKNYYEKVHHDNPEFPNVSYKLGMLLVNYLEGNPEIAANYLQEAFQFDRDNINALYQLGLLLNEDLEEEDAAILAFEKVLERAPEHPFVNYDLAVIYHQRGESEKALQFYEKSAIVNPELKTVVNDQAFAIATDEIEAKDYQVAAIDQQEDDAEKAEQYTISNLVANVHDKPEVTNIANISQENIVSPSDEDVYIEAELKETVKPKPSRKIALITGATSGIGRATAEKFAQEGYQVILTGRRFSRLFQIKEQFEKEYDAKVRLLPFDITSASAVQEALAELEEDWQSIDILVNNAGLAQGETAIHEGELAKWDAMIDTNLKGLLYVTRQIAPYMVKQRKGQIINVCSLAGKEVYPNNAVYCATKHAVDALSKAMRIDLHKYNIRVSQVSPGYVEDTEFSSVKTGGEGKSITDFTPVNAKDVAEVIYFMTTQPAHVTLQEIVMTGTQQATPNIINRSGRI